jgi:cell division initiation protein
MPIRPIDVRRKEFKSSFRGYDANQVDDFLDAVADEFERAYSENSHMREEISSLRERLQQFEELEGSIRAALVHAEQAANDLRRSASREAEDLRSSASREAEDLRSSARREADLTVREAQSRSRQMLAESSSRVERIQESFEALQEAKRGFSSDFRQLLKAYTDVMEQADLASAKEVESALRGRLDPESIAVAREAARHGGAEPYEEVPPLPAEEDRPVTPEGEDDVERETAHLEQETAYLEQETAYLEVSDPETVEPEVEPEVEPSTVEPETSAEPETAGDETASLDATEEPEPSEEPVPSEKPLGSGAGEDEERDESSLAEEEPALAEESRSQDFFDRGGEGSSDEGRGNSRIFRASRFLRRRE